jgi:hypothetical protein
MHPTRTLPSPKTGVIVVDDLSNLLLGSFSRNPKSLKAAAPAAIKEKLEKRAAGRRFQIIESLGAAMSKMATLQNMAILVLSNATISLKGGQKATLKPALSSQAWDTAIHTRIMLFRDFPDDDQGAQLSKLETNALRYAEVQRLARKEVYKLPVPFVILTDGLRQVDRPRAKGDEEEEEVFVDTSVAEAVQPRPPRVDLPLLPDELSQPSQSKKRKATEIADSEDDDDADDVVVQSNQSEVKLPAINLQNEQSSLKKEEVEAEEEEEEEEMILDTHETALLRSYRYASIRGSEDAMPVHSSSDDDKEEQEEDDGDEDGNCVTTKYH